MSNLIAAASGNFTSAGTWGTVHAGSELDSEANTTAVSTSNLDSSTFTLLSTDTYDGVALKLSARAASPTGTFTVTLRNSTTNTDAKTVTVNVSDLPSGTPSGQTGGLGWVFFKFASGFTPANSTDNYLIRVVCSNTGSQVTLFRNATSNNWTRKIRTTTTQAPAANNHLVICGELTGAGTNNAWTVTMDNTAATTWGPSSVGTQGVVVSSKGTLTFGTSASTNYVFQWRGPFLIVGGGVVNIGSSGTRIPSSSSVQLSCDCANNGDTYISIDTGGTLNIYGASKTSWTRLTADYSSGTGITVADTTGWQGSDLLAFSSTDTTRTHDESKTISTVNSGTSVTLSGALSNAHNGTGLPTNYQAYVLNLTRNVKLNSLSGSLRGFLLQPACSGSTVHIEYLELDVTKLATSSFAALAIRGNGGFYCTGVSLNPSTLDTTGQTPVIVSDTNVSGWTIDNLVGYRLGSSNRAVWVNTSSSDTTWVLTNSVLLRAELSGTGWGGFEIGNILGTYHDNVALSCVRGHVIFPANSGQYITDGTKWFNNHATLCSSAGIALGGADGSSGAGSTGLVFYLKGSQLYRNAAGGVRANCPITKLTLDTCDFCGNQSGSTGVDVSVETVNGCWVDTIIANDTTFSCDTGITQQTCAIGPGSSFTALCCRVYLYNCTFGVATGIRSAYANDFSITSNTQAKLQIFATKCKFASNAGTPMANLAADNQRAIGDHVDVCGSFLRAQDWAQTSADHRTFAPQGTMQTDTVVFHNASPSAKLTPNSASYKLRGFTMVAPVKNGNTRTVSVWVRRSKAASGDSADYNGNQPRLIVRRNDAVGITADTVLATGSAAIGNWEQLSGTTISPSEDGAVELFVDCDGTTGFINVDDFAVS